MTVRRLFLLLGLAIGVVVVIVFVKSRVADRTATDPRVVTALTEVRENVRQAAYHLLRLARMSGGGGLPMVSGEAWVAAQIHNNVGGVIEGGLAGPVNALAGSDVLTLRGFFELQPFFVDPTRGDIRLSGDRGAVSIRARPVPGRPDLAAAPGAGSGIVLMGRSQYAVAEVSAMPAGPGWLRDPSGHDQPSHSAVEEGFFDLGFTGGTLPWSRFNIGGIYLPPRFPIYQVGFLDSYTYYVDTQLRLMRIRGRPGGASAPEPVAMHIGGLQVALAVDTNRDGEIEASERLQNPDPELVAIGRPRMLRITVLGRTPFAVDGWHEPATTFAVEDMKPPTSAGTAVDPARAKWCRIQVTALLRSFGP
jgi:hypothetical protein